MNIKYLILVITIFYLYGLISSTEAHMRNKKSGINNKFKKRFRMFFNIKFKNCINKVYELREKIKSISEPIEVICPKVNETIAPGPSEVTCPRVNEIIANGNITFSSLYPKRGSYAKTTCYDGYKPKSGTRRICLENGVWDSEQTICLGGTKLLMFGYEYGSQIIDVLDPSYKCEISDSSTPASVSLVANSNAYNSNYSIAACSDYSHRFDCWLYNGSTWNRQNNIMLKDRYRGYSVQIGDKVWSIGGSDTSTEILDLTDFSVSYGPNFTDILQRQCIVKINESVIYVIGGIIKDTSASIKSTFFINVDTNEMTDGKDLLIARRTMGCALYQNQYVIAAVVFNETSEFLDLKNDGDWTLGPEFDDNLYDIELFNIGTDVYSLGGQKPSSAYIDDIYKFTFDSWEQTDLKLVIPDKQVKSVFISDILADSIPCK